ncbi:MAG TPA: NAD(P) transhydrogenase subunit alpha [Actinomycetaceae bacterium]|nr:NAD(P) transhydrogenase subunit alpha [Actinomycetaceae bacterium]
MITISVPKEPEPETRVAVVPETVKSMVRAGHRVLVEEDAGLAAAHPNSEYSEAGAEVVSAIDLTQVDVLAHITSLPPGAIARLRRGAVTIGLAGPYEPNRVAALAQAGVTAMSFETLPRTSRAQAMDVLSSQALASGYRCVLEAAIRSPRFFPMAMTAAGTVPPAKVVVLGIGVAGLQAIATAKRLGAIVFANDIRPDSAEEAQSVGATFIEVPVDSSEGTGTGGYARALGDEAAFRQREALKPFIADADVLITTAAVPGRRAPRLATAEMVAAMRPGAVVVDLAAPNGGNVEGSVVGEDVKIPSARGGGEITIVGIANAPGDLPTDASRLFSKNVDNVLKLIVRDGELNIDFGDDIVDGMTITHGGVNRLAPEAEQAEQAVQAAESAEAEENDAAEEAQAVEIEEPAEEVGN